MKREQLMNNIEKKDRFDYSIDEVSLRTEVSDKPQYTPVKTYYNTIQNLLTSESYRDVLENTEQLDTRRRALEIIFYKRVEFNINQKIRYMQAYLAQYDIYINHIGKEIKEMIPELFDITFYFNLMTNPTSGFDYAMALNSILYNHLFESVRCNNTIDFNQGLEYINRFMSLALNEWMHMLNLLYLEANEVYYKAGNASILDLKENQDIYLHGEERKQALIEMGRPDLIDTDIMVGRI